MTTPARAAGTVGATCTGKETSSRLFSSKLRLTITWTPEAYALSLHDALPIYGPVTVTKNGDYLTPSGASPSQAGTYFWVATYSGDANNKEAASEIGRAPV